MRINSRITAENRHVLSHFISATNVARRAAGMDDVKQSDVLNALLEWSGYQSLVPVCGVFVQGPENHHGQK